MTVLSVVRQATSADKDEVWRLFKLCHRENGLSPMNEGKVNYYIDRLLEPEKIRSGDNGPRGLIGVIGPIGALEGVIMLAFGSQWYTDQISMDEYLNFVDPEHRSSYHAQTLIDYAKHMVDLLLPDNPGLKLIIGVLSTFRTAAKVRLYERKLKVSGCFFVYPPIDEVSLSSRDKRRMLQ